MSSSPCAGDSVVKEQIRQRAFELGFNDCRFTSALPPESSSRLREWLAAGRHGEMAYLQRNAEKRFDPQLVLPGARSVIALAASYFLPGASRAASAAAPNPGANAGAPTSAQPGAVARYARFADYHDVLAERLRLLNGFVQETGGPPTRSLWYVDTGPILERAFAERAGLGFVGKHTNLISRKLGNWILLSEILTTLELEPDPPETNRCGNCARCLTACPTQAITAPFQLDARRCISYLTIELKGSIPVELRPAIGNRVFGCDDCLAACPWNRFAREGSLLREYARENLAEHDLPSLLSLDEAEFRRRFAGTPILRSKRRGLLRNVCVALGNAGDARALPALNRAVRDPEPLVAEHAQWAREQILIRACSECATRVSHSPPARF